MAKVKAPIDYSVYTPIRGIGQYGGLCIILDMPGPYQKNGYALLSGIEEEVVLNLVDAMGLDSRSIWWTYGIPFLYNKKIGQDLISIQHKRLLAELEIAAPQKILVMGSTAQAVLCNEPFISSINKLRGNSFTFTGLDSNPSVYTVTTIPAYYVTANTNTFRDLVTDIGKLANRDYPMKEPVCDLFVPHTLAELKECLGIFKPYDRLSCDLETSGFDPLNDEIWAIGFGTGEIVDNRIEGKALVVPKDLIYKPGVMDTLYRWMYYGDTTFTFHNAKFDLKFLRVYFGQYIDDIKFDDTILLNYVLDERPIGGESGRGISAHGLKTIARVRYDAHDYKFDFESFAKTSEPRDYTSLYTYLALDLLYTAQLYYDLCAEIEAESVDLYIPYRELLIEGTKAIIEIELHGILLDIEYLKSIQGDIQQKANDALLDMQTLILGCGGDIELARDFNPRSAPQVSKVLYELFDAPRLNGNHADEKTLAILRQKLEPCYTTDFMDLLLSYREYQKLLSTYIIAWQNAVDKNNRFHGNFKLNGTETGRLSADIQQTPRPTKTANLRKAFIASPGYVFLNADYSQLEMRVAGILSGDKNLTAIFAENRDMHTETASRFFKVPIEELKAALKSNDKELLSWAKALRSAAKPVGFGILYGRGAEALVNHPDLVYLHYNKKQGEALIASFLEQFSELKEWIKGIKNDIHEKGYIETPFHRRRRFPFIYAGNREDSYREAVNYPIQGYASDFGLYSLIKLNVLLRQYDSHIVCQVHDSLMLEVKAEYADTVAQLVKDIMENPPVVTELPIIAEVEYGANWGDLK
jgi:DNA polymerase I-like protein with 3'-5' exonuclease and polymerase domains